MLEEFDNRREPCQTMNLLKAIRFVIRSWDEVTAQTIANCWQHSKLNIQLPLQPLIQSQAQDAITELQKQLRDLERLQHIKDAMSIQQLLQPSDEVVEDSPEDIDEQIAQLYEPVVKDDSEPEEVEVLPRIKADQALQLLR